MGAITAARGGRGARISEPINTRTISRGSRAALPKVAAKVYALLGAWCSRLQAICRRGQGRARCNDRDLHDWGDTPKKGACGARNHVPTSRQRVVRIDGNRRWRR